MRICIDIDNTILNYEPLFFEESNHIPKGIQFLSELKEYLQNKSQEEWLKIQGLCYGKRVRDVTLFQKSKESIEKLIKNGYEVFLVSHKTKTSYCGNYSGLQELVTNRLQELGLTSLIDAKNIFLLESLDEKLKKINELKPQIVIDDLEKVTSSSKLDQVPLKILFSRFSSRTSLSSFSWPQIVSLIELVKSKNLFFQRSLSTGNNSVCKFKSNDGSFVLKCFSKEERYKREKVNLSLLNQNVQILFSDDEGLLLLTSFAEGKAPSEYNKNVFEKLSNIFKIKSPIQATHRRVSIDEYLEHIENRLLSGKAHYSNFLDLHQNLLVRAKNAKYSPVYEAFCSPDMSLDNLIENDGHIQMIDLESSGMDDPLRSLANAVFHSRNSLEENQILELFSFFNDQFPGIFSNSFELVLDLVAFDWLLLEKDPFKSVQRAETYQSRLSGGKIYFSLPESIIEHGKRISQPKEL